MCQVCFDIFICIVFLYSSLLFAMHFSLVLIFTSVFVILYTHHRLVIYISYGLMYSFKLLFSTVITNCYCQSWLCWFVQFIVPSDWYCIIACASLFTQLEFVYSFHWFILYFILRCADLSISCFHFCAVPLIGPVCFGIL